jgi:4-hydroxy-tetrahydrodipicolinate reductase
MGVTHIIGTTGFNERDEDIIAECALKTTIVKSGNMSLGVNLLAALVEQAAQKLSDEWDIEILEMHHKHKVDAPSGTALLLGEAAAKGRGVSLKDKRVSTRDGHTGARIQGDIGFATLRGGMIVGEHEVTFASDSERIILSHKAADRGLFARGALHAALWTKGKPNGLYNMKDVLGL